ncbi:MAG TPA: DUF2795 domain-containing protein [Actinophytocola sp.]|uniref:DUF2795 domain-containing protein n=1 Tax=Actinophytocola sp. TaxID=1872138 RepID=UPI002DB79806|nr:DUF2795 domain-containing protein [Actinophytocola sp.]HEU5470501.1 DUF2795 domain-containing protein [Actinophytocola sp.]
MDGRREITVRQVLHGLTYPAEKWQIVTQADLYGADAGTIRDLFRLPTREYRDPHEITAALDAAS